MHKIFKKSIDKWQIGIKILYYRWHANFINIKIRMSKSFTNWQRSWKSNWQKRTYIPFRHIKNYPLLLIVKSEFSIRQCFFHLSNLQKLKCLMLVFPHVEDLNSPHVLNRVLSGYYLPLGNTFFPPFCVLLCTSQAGLLVLPWTHTARNLQTFSSLISTRWPFLNLCVSSFYSASAPKSPSQRGLPWPSS